MEVISPQSRFAKLIEEFFLDRLIRQGHTSPQTMSAYGDCFRLLFAFARDQRGTPPGRIGLADLEAPFVLAFLDHLEESRRSSIRGWNARLAALRSLPQFAAWKEPNAIAFLGRPFTTWALAGQW